MSWQIAIDGPAGAGKSTIAKMLADRLGFEYIDTGAMYRAVALKALALRINMYEENEYKFLDETKIDFIDRRIYLDGIDVSDKIRSLVVSNNASLVASFGYVRTKLVSLQRALANEKNVIMDGRDIGTAVLPNANLKIYLVASVEERARRRQLERIEKGQELISLDDTIKEIEERDYKDSSRPINPLAIADDAIVVDSSNLIAEKVVDKIIKLVLERGYKMKELEKVTNPIEEVKVEETSEEKVEKPKATRKKKVAEEVETQAVVEEKPKTTRKKKATEEENVQEAVAEEKPKTTRKKKVVEEEVKVEEKEETTTDEETKQEVVEEVVVETADEVVAEDEEDDIAEDALSDDIQAVEEEDADVAHASTYRELQIVEGTVVEVLEEKPAFTRGGKTFKEKPERVLIELEDGQQGFLFRKDTHGIQDNEDLFDLFFEGDKVQVVIKKIYPDGGKFIFSTILLKLRNDLKEYEKLINKNHTFKAKVVKKLSVGYLLKVGEISCLLPESQVVKGAENIVGQEIEVSPIRIDYGRIRLIVSQTVAAGILRTAEKEKFIKSIKVGDVFEGTVKDIQQFGVFVEIAKDIDGLLHISEVDHFRVVKLNRIFEKGDKVQVKVINIENDRIGLSRKALIPNYWQEYTDKNVLGTDVDGKITEINNSGVVVELAENVSGFLPRSEFAYERNVQIEDYVSIGETISTRIIEIDVQKKRIILSRKQLLVNPWDNLNIKVNDYINVTVFKEIKDGYIINYNNAQGYLPKTNIVNYDKPINVGESLKVRVRVFDAANTRLIVQLRTEQERVEREVYGKFTQQQPQEKFSSTFGDLLEAQLKKKNK